LIRFETGPGNLKVEDFSTKSMPRHNSCHTFGTGCCNHISRSEQNVIMFFSTLCTHTHNNA